MLGSLVYRMYGPTHPPTSPDPFETNRGPFCRLIAVLRFTNRDTGWRRSAQPRLIGLIALVCWLTLSGCGKILPGSAPSTRLRFTAMGPETGIDFRHDAGIERTPLLHQQLGAGCAVFDFNNDGWLDLFFVQGAPPSGESPEPRWNNRLYQGGPGWRFTDVTDRAGVAGRVGTGKPFGIGCAVGDWDRDGDEDLLVTSRNGTLFYRNQGDGTFRDDSVNSGLPQEGLWTSATFLDYDRDGWLDLYLCRYGAPDTKPGAMPAPTAAGEAAGAERPARTTSRLYRNVGGQVFRDVTAEAGVLEPNSRSLGVLASDLDADGWTDLCVTNDGVRNFLFRNDRGVFLERGREAGVAVDESGVARPGRGLAGADVNDDQLPDLFMTHGLGYSNQLYLSTPDKALKNGTAAAGLAAAEPAPRWGCAFADFDLDGRQDLVVLGGSPLSPIGDGETPGTPQRPRLYRGEGGGVFRPMEDHLGPWFREAHDARGVATGDLDNDGDVDLVVTRLNGAPALLRNDQREKNHWFQLRLVGTESNLSGIGARVTAIVEGQPHVTEIRSGAGYLCAQSPTAIFGLRSARALDGLEVRWPSGAVDALPPVLGDRLLILKEGGDLLPAPGASATPQGPSRSKE